MSYKILIVDDEPDNIRVIRNCITGANEPYTLFQALKGELAVKIAEAEIPDLIITDWEMPGMDGIELIKILKQNKNTSEIPIIMCTGVMTSSENLYTALMAGAVDYVRKPIDTVELIARVKSMLELSDSKKALRERLQVIEQNNKFIHALMESIPYPMVYYSPDGTIKGENHHFEKLIGLSDQDIIGKKMYDLVYFSNAIHRKFDFQLLNNRSAVAYEENLVDQVFIFSKTIFYNAAAEPEGIFCIMVDITDLKKAHTEIIENKKKELTSSALRLIQVSELNNSLISELKKVNRYTSKKGNELISSIVSTFSISSNENFWNEFESRFASVYESFYENLANLFPDLTPGEKKMCALLRLNLSSKEIAALIFQNPKSVDMARYRLRRKMNLKQDENLTDFLMKIN